MAALNPADCALLTLSSKLHPPLTINKKGWFKLSSIVLLLKGSQASNGSARNNVPHSPEPFTGGAKLASMSSKAKVRLFPIKTTLAVTQDANKHRKQPNTQ